MAKAKTVYHGTLENAAPRHLYTDANSWEEWGYDPTENK